MQTGEGCAWTGEPCYVCCVISKCVFLLQALCDQQMFEKADANFKKSLEVEPENGNIYVHRG